MGSQRKITKHMHVFYILSGPWKDWKDWPEMATHGARIFFPTNPDLADMLGRPDLDFDNLYVFVFLDSKFPDLQVPRFPGPQKSGLGQAWAGMGPGWARLAY